MKNIIFLFALFSFHFLLIMCEGDQDNETNNKLIHVKTNYTGCNGSFDLTKTTRSTGDSVSFSFEMDTLNIYVNLRYICCTPFTSNVAIQGDSIIMTIKDICPGNEMCYCRCFCFYGFNFIFTGLENKIYSYKVAVNERNNSFVVKEGKFNPFEPD
ncbi:MAG: hypothetical protein HC906_05805 [Bacteroidales bacterium]|nr:hypothetical protein [Bacteroidales bacterium]